MAEKRQFFRDINPGDVSIEGRQSNGMTARSDGSVILYSGVKENELENLQNYNGNIPVDGYLGNIIAVLKADQEVAYPLGNNNEETYIESAQIDPNKIITTTSPDDVVFDPCKNKNILIVGDSITVDAGFTWSSLYKKNQTDKDVKILAIVGKQLTAWMKPEVEKELKVNKYDTVIIYGGVNDTFSGKKTPNIIKDLQSMVDNVVNNKAQAIVITGYDAEKDMDINKMPITKYVKTANEYKPLLEEYQKFQSNINTIKNALIIPKVSIGVLGDGFHPNGTQAKLLYDHILTNIPNCDDTKTTPQQSTDILPNKEIKTPKPAPSSKGPIYDDEFIFTEGTQPTKDPVQLTGLARHINDRTQEFVDMLNNINDVKNAPSNKSSLPPITASDKTEYTLVYLGHNQGNAGLKSILYYTFKEPSQKVPTSNKFTSANINGNMFGFRLNGTKYVKITYANWSTNVGDDFIKTFGKDIETSYTPGNFFTYWASYKIPLKIDQAKKTIPSDLNNLFTKLSGEYGVPLDYIITTAFIESGFNPKAGNANYKGLFALSESEFKKYYPTGDIFNKEQNARAGVQVLKDRVKEAKLLFDEYKSYFK